MVKFKNSGLKTVCDLESNEISKFGYQMLLLLLFYLKEKDSACSNDRDTFWDIDGTIKEF